MSKSSNTDEPILGDGVKAPEEMAKLQGEVSPDATVPGVADADTTGAHAADDTKKGDS